MKMHSLHFPSNSSGSLAIHRAVQGRFGDSKSYGHRYERRKVREYLRQADGQNQLGATLDSFAR